MAITFDLIPVSSTFDFAGYLAYRRSLLDTPYIWTVEHPDHMRLPANIEISEFLIYVGMVFRSWMNQIGVAGEKPLYSPKYPDIIYSYTGRQQTATVDSPHTAVPPSVAYCVRKRAPASMGPQMFGPHKQWKYRNCGEFQGSDGNVYTVRLRRWENLVEFTVIGRSGGEADALVSFFERFMDLNERAFLEAGLEKIVPVGRLDEPDTRLDQAGVHYRKTLFWTRTEEFQYAGPVTTISDMDFDVAQTDSSHVGNDDSTSEDT